jgi:hypothetical protein
VVPSGTVDGGGVRWHIPVVEDCMRGNAGNLGLEDEVAIQFGELELDGGDDGGVHPSSPLRERLVKGRVAASSRLVRRVSWSWSAIEASLRHLVKATSYPVIPSLISA